MSVCLKIEPFEAVPSQRGDRVRVTELPRTAEGAYRKYSSYVAAVAYRLAGRDSEVDDIVQEVFLRAVKGLHQLQDERAMKGWLATVTVRVVKRRMWKRGIARKLGFGTPPPDDGDSIAPGASPEQQALLSQVYRVMDRLPTNQRLAWTLPRACAENSRRIVSTARCAWSAIKSRCLLAYAIARTASAMSGWDQWLPLG